MSGPFEPTPAYLAFLDTLHPKASAQVNKAATQAMMAERRKHEPRVPPTRVKVTKAKPKAAPPAAGKGSRGARPRAPKHAAQGRIISFLTKEDHQP